VTPVDYEFLRKLLRERSGLDLSSDKQYLVESRLIPLARRVGLAGIPELVQKIKSGSETLTSEVVEAMTTNETFFFRIPGADTGARQPPQPAHLVRGFLHRAGAVFDRDVREGIRRAIGMAGRNRCDRSVARCP
jgi:hypothetical protein